MGASSTPSLAVLRLLGSWRPRGTPSCLLPDMRAGQAGPGATSSFQAACGRVLAQLLRPSLTEASMEICSEIWEAREHGVEWVGCYTQRDGQFPLISGIKVTTACQALRLAPTAMGAQHLRSLPRATACAQRWSVQPHMAPRLDAHVGTGLHP